MKTFILTLLLSLSFIGQASANGAVSYLCTGKNALDRHAVQFELMFSDYARGEGYTNESISISRIGWESLEKPYVLQIRGGDAKNDCKVNDLNEIYINHENFNMLPTEEGNAAAYKITFISKCGGSRNFDVTAYCFFEH